MIVSNRLRIVIALLSSFLFVLLPFLHIYANNVTNLQLPISAFTNDLILLSLIVFVGILLFLKVLPEKFEAGVFILLAILNVVIWMQINFFIGQYGFLDGGEPEWDVNFTSGVLQLIVYLTLAALFFRFRERVAENMGFGAAVLIFSSLIYVPQLLETASKPTHKKYTFTKDGIYDFSSDHNVIIFVLDTMQADVVNEIFEDDPGLTEAFDGFTFFRNSLSAFPKTYASIPAILSGRPFDNSETLSTYLEAAYINESLPAFLKKQDYDTRHWSSSAHALIAHPFVSDNVADADGAAIGGSTIGVKDKQLVVNMVLFRLAPHFLKPWIYNDGEFRIELNEPDLTANAESEICRLTDADRRYSKSVKAFDTVFADEFRLCAEVKSVLPVFRFFHLYGAHAPLRFDKDFNFIGNQSIKRNYFKGQAHGTLKVLAELLELLKQKDIYDNSTIVVVGDHGEGEYPVGLNLEQTGLPVRSDQTAEKVGENKIRGGIALTMVKPAGARESMLISDAPVEVTDVMATVLDDLGYNTDNVRGMPVYSIPEDSNRIRYHKYYQFGGWNVDYLLPLTEYEVSGFSWYENNWRRSGNDLNANAQSAFKGTLITLIEGGNLESTDNDGWTKATRAGRKITGQTASLMLDYPAQGSAILSIVHSLNENKTRLTEELKLTIGDIAVGSWTFRYRDGQRKKSILLGANEVNLLTDQPLVLTLEEPEGKTKIKEIRLTSVDDYDYRPGGTISFKDTGNSAKYRTHGWSRTEIWGTSSIGHESGVFVKLPESGGGDYILEFRASAYTYDVWPEQRIDIVINDVLIDTLVITDTKKNLYQMPIPASVLGPENLLDIKFRYRDPVKLSELGLSGDTRLHAVDMVYLKVVESASVAKEK